jgi:uncharacterized protein (DUF697 family)/GTP-binding protein EngB required for normal cell division
MADSPTDAWFRDQFQRHWRDAADKVGRFNLAIFGKTGVGKSTLINTVFGAEVAETGIGEPVTREEHLYLHDSGFLGLLDTRGLEIGVDTDQIITELGEYVARMRRQPVKDQVHLAWYCVRANDRRFEETEASFIRKLDELGLPVLLVMTQVVKVGDNYHPDALALKWEIEALELPIFEGRVHLTMAKPDDFAGYPRHGLQELLDASFRGAPDAVAAALTAAQTIDMKRKRDHAIAITSGAATAAGAAGATPIPFSDAVLLVPIQIGMMAGISVVYGIEMDKAAVASVAATASATTLGRSAATNLLKFVPGIGSVVGGTINATIASGFTMAMGTAWSVVCAQLAQGKLSAVDNAADTQVIRELFLEELKKQIGRLDLRSR